MGVWFFVAFGLTSNLLLPIGTIMGERLAYIPLVGFLGYIVAEAAYEFDRRQVAQRVQLYVLVAVCLVFTLTSSMRMSVWQSNHALFSQTVRDAPQSPVAAFNYGLHLYKDKQDISRAQTYFRRSYELFPNSTLPIRMLVATSLKQREFGRAEFWLRKLLTLDPKDQGAATQLDKLLQLKSRAQKLGDDVRYSFDAGQ